MASIKSYFVSFYCLMMLLSSLPCDAQELQFPLRSKYASVRTVSSEWLYDHRYEVIIVDVRSVLEYNVLHISTSKHIPISNKGFIHKLREIRARDARPIVFYCNGITCQKSYKANLKAQRYNIDNVYTFDAGVFNWARAYPYATLLFSRSLASEDRLISAAKLSSHTLSPEDFVAKISQDTLVFDIRDPFQRHIEVLSDVAVQAPLDRFSQTLARIKKNNKTLLLFDAVGKQVRWLQYSIEKEGISNYYFMRGGAAGYVKSSVFVGRVAHSKKKSTP